MPFDAYLLWRLFTGSLGVPWKKANSGGETPDKEAATDYVAVLVELSDPDQTLAAFDFIPTHTNSVVEGAMRPSFRAGLVPNNGKLLDLFFDARMQQYNKVLRVELALPRSREDLEPARAAVTEAVNAALPAEAKLSLEGISLADLAVILRKPKAVPAQLATSPPNQGSRQAAGEAPFVCVIDDGCNFSSASLLRAGQSRVSRLIIQGSDRETEARLERAGRSRASLSISLTLIVIPGLPTTSSFSFRGATIGRLLETQFLTGPMAPVVQPGKQIDTADEPGAYRQAGYLDPPPRTTHGAAMLDLVMTPPPATGGQTKGPPAPANVLFIQLPAQTVLDTAGGSLGAFVLDGIHEALQSASATAQPRDVIVNLSFGNHSGGHDGSSMFERALCELLDKYNGSAEAGGRRLHVVLPAGNSHLLRCHAAAWCRRGTPNTVYWKVLPDDETDNFVEVWVPRGSEVQIGIKGPGLSQPVQLALGGGAFSYKLLRRIVNPGSPSQAQAPVFGMIAAVNDPVQSTTGSMFLIALTASPLKEDTVRKVTSFLNPVSIDKEKDKNDLLRSFGEERPTAPGALAHGVWTITVEATGRDPVHWHAWVQRGDAAPLRGRTRRGLLSRQSHFLDTELCGTDPAASPAGTGKVDPAATLNGIATMTHDRLYVVGASFRDDGRVSDYSGAGPNRDNPDRTYGPDFVMPTDDSWNLRGTLVRSFVGEGRHRVSGTSAAAASFTRLLHDALSSGQSLAGASCAPASLLPQRERGVQAPCAADDWLRGECHRIEASTPAPAGLHRPGQ